MTFKPLHEWPEDRQEKLRTLWAKRDMSLPEIAAAIGVPRSTLYRVADVMGLPQRARSNSLTEVQIEQIEKLHKSGMSYRAIERATGICDRTVSRYLSNLALRVPRGRWTLSEVDLFHREWNPAVSPDANARRIGAKIGRHPEGVLSKAKMVGLCGNTEVDPHRPTPEDAAKHASICLAQGGFPWRELVNGRSVEFRPLVREAQAA
ncbi:hypothetical protein [Phenylobacterium sp.]|uniref:helix-turn-helix domain-containing protein n=1 Tax=Phenylobacterium sp. TaxID=1871053 RepID=UPI00261BA88A|nr:hypothetical protein [Phenylobacterium sp.]